MSNPYARLAVVTRSGRVESEHWGVAIVCDADGRVVRSCGDPEFATYMRSAAKPFQAITCLRHGVADRFGWTDAELALVCASHSSEPEHVAVAESILAKAGLSADLLQCGPHPPLGETRRDQLIREGRNPTRIMSNCSGKHSGMLSCCLHKGWPLDSYRLVDHPLQAANRTTFGEYAGVDGDVPTGLDGCGVPTFFSSLRGMATSFAKLASSNADANTTRVRNAMVNHSHLVAGTGRLDTDLMKFAAGRLVSKCGAEGVQCVGVVGAGIGVAIKAADGAGRALPIVAVEMLRPLLPDLAWETLLPRINPAIINTLGEQAGTIEAVVC